VDPVQAALTALRDEVAAVRQDLAALSQQVYAAHRLQMPQAVRAAEQAAQAYVVVRVLGRQVADLGGHVAALRAK
jgi:hypothetical protein